MKKQNVTNTENVATSMVDGLEQDVQTQVDGLEQDVETQEVDYSSIEFLKNNVPFFPSEHTSAKHKADREPKIQRGIAAILENDKEFNPLFALLGLWWENKAARAEIKKMIDAEAESKNINPVVYMQENLRNQALKFDAIQDAVDRLKYASTYFKPRGGVKDVFKQFSIGGKFYNVNLTTLTELKAKYPNEEDKQTLIAEIVACSQEIVIDNELVL